MTNTSHKKRHWLRLLALLLSTVICFHTPSASAQESDSGDSSSAGSAESEAEESEEMEGDNDSEDDDDDDNDNGDDNDSDYDSDYDNDYDGYDADGYDEDGYDADGYDEDGFDEDGYDEDGYDEDGFDEDGYDEFGLDFDEFEAFGTTAATPATPKGLPTTPASQNPAINSIATIAVADPLKSFEISVPKSDYVNAVAEAMTLNEMSSLNNPKQPIEGSTLVADTYSLGLSTTLNPAKGVTGEGGFYYSNDNGNPEFGVYKKTGTVEGVPEASTSLAEGYSSTGNFAGDSKSVNGGAGMIGVSADIDDKGNLTGGGVSIGAGKGGGYNSSQTTTTATPINFDDVKFPTVEDNVPVDIGD